MSEAQIEARILVTLILLIAAGASALGMPWQGYLGWALGFALVSFIRYAWQRKP